MQQKYKVIGPFTTHGVATGLVFEADLAPEHAKRLIDQGAIEEVAENRKVTFDGEVELGDLERPVPDQPEGPGPTAGRQFRTPARTEDEPDTKE
jgi:hypothetical protein